jgi:IPT/TIG domain
MSATTSTQATSANATPISVQADNLLRRVLRISDPRNAQEVADGLGRAYPTQSAELNEEIQGLPIGLPVPALVTTGAPVSIASSELIQAQSNIQRDLDFLTGSSQLKEVQVELQGWGETIRTWLADGAAAAPQALDAAARDRVFSARRYLLDYAWVSRLVGGQTPGLSISYRRFARSLDEAAGLLLVSAGEALSQNNYSGDRLLLQAPASELSARADAAAAALLNLSGSVQNAFSPTAWPWGLDSYRRLLERLESAGHGDIRVLLQENSLRAFTDELVNRASDVTGDGLRGLAATHVVALERVDRLIQVGTEFARESPPLAAFLSALQLFVDTFRGGTATRLIALGRPLLSSAGLYTFGGLDPGTYTLQNLVQYRSIIAQLNDSLFGMDLTLPDAEAQFVADSCLYAIDLAIDLYAVGVNPKGQGIIEQRAAAYGLFVWELVEGPNGLPALVASPGTPNRARPLLPSGSWPPSPAAPSIYLLISTLVNAIIALGLTGTRQIYPPISVTATLPTISLTAPSLVRTSTQNDLRVIAQELAIIESRHSGLLPLVSALTPGNYDPTQVLIPMEQALQAAKALVGGRLPDKLKVPPPVEATLIHGVRTLAPPGVPTVSSVSPTSGAATGGTSVTIIGTGFTSLSSVAFGTTSATAAPATKVAVQSDTLISANSPPGIGGPAYVFVTTPAGTSAPAPSVTFGYLPQVTALNPNYGPTGGGTLITITGSGFTDANGVVFDATNAGGFRVNSDTEIVTASPTGTTGTVNVNVTTATLPSGPPIPFEYIELSITTITPNKPSGTLVTITGQGFAGATGVRFGTAVVTDLNVNGTGTTILVAPPPHARDKVAVRVITPVGATPPFFYTYAGN